MPAITQRFTGKPLLNLQRIGHGTLAIADVAKSRRFYEEVLGLDVIQTSPRSLMFKKGTEQVYAAVEIGPREEEMHVLNHNGLDVASVEEVDAAYETLLKVKDEYEIREIRKPAVTHGDYCFYFVDLDGNMWEIVKVRPGGHATDFDEPERDMTGRSEEFLKRRGVRVHMHDDDFRDSVNETPS